MEGHEKPHIPALDPTALVDSPEQAEQLRNEIFKQAIMNAADIAELKAAIHDHFDRGGSIVASTGPYTEAELHTLIDDQQVDAITREYGLRAKVRELMVEADPAGENAVENEETIWGEWMDYFEQLAAGVTTRNEFRAQIKALSDDPAYASVQPLFAELGEQLASLEAAEQQDKTIAEVLFPKDYRTILGHYMRLP